MQAAVYRKYGPPEVVSIEEMPIPEPGVNEILIQVVASTVNRTDAGFRSASYFVSRFWSGLLRPRFPVLGCTFSGIVAEVGAGVNRFSVGDFVFGFNDQKFGGHAAFTVQHADGPIAHVPKGIPLDEAAAIPEGANYALVILRAAKVQPGQHVLVYGASGAIGSAAIQLLRAFGAITTAVCPTHFVAKAHTLGVHQVIDYEKEEFTSTHQPYDLVFDAVGKSSFGTCKALLKPQGLYISTELGKGSQNVFLTIWGRIFKNRKRVLFPIPTFSKEDMEWLAAQVKQGIFYPVVDRRYPLAQIVEAYHYVETGQKVGNVLLVL